MTDLAYRIFGSSLQTWIDRNYRNLMLLAMVIELLMLGWIAYRA